MTHLANTFGVEIECFMPAGVTHDQVAAAVAAKLGKNCRFEGYNHSVRPSWKIVTDRSLVPFDLGMELVSPILRGEEGLTEVRLAMDALQEMGCKVDRQCGLHVHVGVGNAGTAFFKNLFKLYAHFEPVIDTFMPASRRANSYCRTVRIEPARIDATTGLDGMLSLMLRNSGSYEARYHKLNLDAYRRHQTVEFRQHGGTVEGQKARQWILFCLRMVEAAREGKGSEIGRGGAQVNRGRDGTKSRLVGDLMLRPEGVTNREAAAVTGWRSVEFRAHAEACGLTFTTERFGRETRYFARAAAVAPVPATLDSLMDMIGCENTEREYFAARVQRFGRIDRIAA